MWHFSDMANILVSSLQHFYIYFYKLFGVILLLRLSREGKKVAVAKLGDSKLVIVDKKTIIAYPGDKACFNIKILGPVRHIVHIVVSGIPVTAASISISPSTGRAPFDALATLVVNEYAKPGVYMFNLVVNDYTDKGFNSRETLKLIILPRRLAIQQYNELVKLFLLIGLALKWFYGTISKLVGLPLLQSWKGFTRLYVGGG